jgi:hypothetical protein
VKLLPAFLLLACDQPVAPPVQAAGSISGRVVSPKGPLANAFVYVKSGLSGRFAPPAEPVLLDQKDMQFAPRVFGIMVGQPLKISSSDPSIHNVNCRAFNVSVQQGETVTKKFAEAEVMATLRCDVHPWMFAYAGVLEHPFYAVTGPDGAFEIRGVPAGEFELEAWDEKRGTRRVRARAPGTASFEFP